VVVGEEQRDNHDGHQGSAKENSLPQNAEDGEEKLLTAEDAKKSRKGRKENLVRRLQV
jgi:hypothetical protein